MRQSVRDEQQYEEYWREFYDQLVEEGMCENDAAQEATYLARERMSERNEAAIYY